MKFVSSQTNGEQVLEELKDLTKQNELKNRNYNQKLHYWRSRVEKFIDHMQRDMIHLQDNMCSTTKMEIYLGNRWLPIERRVANVERKLNMLRSELEAMKEEK
jgi:hypothetical protein